MSSLNQAHEALIHSVADRYRKDGYEITIKPDASAIPFDLSNYRPDLIARKGDLSYIVEIKARSQQTSFEQLRPLIEETKLHAGWHFVLVTGQDVLGLDVQGEADRQVPWEDIQRGIEHAKTLSASGEIEAAYLMMWIAFEQMMRNQAFQIDLPLDRLAPSVLIRQLYSEGELTMEQFDVAIHCQALRNRVVHGFRAPEVLDGLGRLRDLLRDLFPQWSTLDRQSSMADLGSPALR